MSKIIIGCDPDSKASGIAIYENRELDQLKCMTLIDIFKLFYHLKVSRSDCIDVELHIENLNGISASAFHYSSKDNQAVKSFKSQSVGKCKQVQVEIERIAEYYDVKIVHHKVSKMWKKDRRQFELITNWKKQSNEDSRSAAYFGWLGAK